MDEELKNIFASYMKNAVSSDDLKKYEAGNMLILQKLGFKHYDYKQTYPYTIIIDKGAYGWVAGNRDHVYVKSKLPVGGYYRTIRDANFHEDWNKLIFAIHNLTNLQNFIVEGLDTAIYNNERLICWDRFIKFLNNGSE